MEQQLDATYLAHDHLERSSSFAIKAIFGGLGILLAAWGISYVWKIAPGPADLRIVNPEPRPIPSEALSTFTQLPSAARIAHDQSAIIRREVTVFASVQHASGTVVTGWSYRNGSGGAPTRQFCYFTSQNTDRTSTRVDLAVDRVQLPSLNLAAVPNADEAVAKCQWLTG